MAAIAAALQASAPLEECCLSGDECLPWSPIFGPCAEPCACPVPTPVPTPTPTPVPDPCLEGVFELMPMVNDIAANYVQAPSAVRTADGVVVVLDWGWCCLAPDGIDGGERIGYLRLPWTGTARYEEWFSTQTWQVEGYWMMPDGHVEWSAQAHEAAYPSIALTPWGWTVWYAATTWPLAGELIHIGAINVTQPDGFRLDVHHPNIFVQGRHVWSPTLVQIGDKLWVYSNDMTQPVGTRTVRQWVQGPQTIGAGEPVVLSGVADHRGITDVAVADDGTVWALENQDIGPITLWRSADGLTFTKVRDITRAGQISFDGGFLRTPTGGLVEPMVVFGNVRPIDGEMFDRWRLAWWADAGAALPQSLTGCWTPRPPRRRLPKATPTGRPEIQIP